MAVRIDRIHGEFHRPVFRQQAHQTTGLEIVMDQKAGGKADAAV